MAINDKRLPSYQGATKPRNDNSMSLPNQTKKDILNKQKIQGGEGSVGGYTGDSSGVGASIAKTATNIGDQVSSQITSPLATIGTNVGGVVSDTYTKDYDPTKGAIGSPLSASIPAVKAGLGYIGSDIATGAQGMKDWAFGKTPEATATPAPSSIVAPVVSTTPSSIEATAPTSLTRSVVSGRDVLQGQGFDVSAKSGTFPKSTPESLKRLGATIDRNADPVFKAKLAEQSAIADKRIEEGKASRAQANLGQVNQNNQGNSEASQLSNYLSEHMTPGLALHRLGQLTTADISDRDNAALLSKQGFADSAEAEKQRLTQEQKAQESRQTATKEMLSASDGMADPSTRFAIHQTHTRNAPISAADLRLIHANDPDPAFRGALNSGNPQIMSDFMAGKGYDHKNIVNVLQTWNK